MHPMLNVAVRAARQAGRVINRASVDVETVQVTRKDRNDFVTDVDRASEAAIIETLLAAYPGHAVLAEESGFLPGKSAQASTPLKEVDHLWIIDPLDGTTNFIHGLPHYCVSIALMERGQITQGLIFDPTRNELFTATRGRGAYLNDRRIRCGKRFRLEDALIGTGFPFRAQRDQAAYLGVLQPLVDKSAIMRRTGSAALDLAYVASGRFDAFFEVGLKVWDVAAGSLLVTEAGGLIGDFNGEADHLDNGQLLAGNPKMFSALIPVLQPVLGDPAPLNAAARQDPAQPRRQLTRKPLAERPEG
ncbi:MAG: inositol monophosphatase family protein [Lautropia sp.]|nr:inositol monophosphatase family protein [Lautropia sp.]